MKKVSPGLKVPDPPVPNRAHTDMSIKETINNENIALKKKIQSNKSAKEHN